MRPIEALAGEVLERQRAADLWRELRWVEGPQGPWIRIGDQKVLLLCSNNYLGLAAHPALQEAAARAARDYGVGAGASRLISGSMRVHRELEEMLARWKHAEAALLFPSGYHANIGAICSLVGKGDAVFSDALNHASIIDGCRLSGATIHVYPHNDVDALRSALAGSMARTKLVITESVFSMDGDVAPLPAIAEIAAKAGAILMVDEAHATGVLGPTGAGAAELFGLCDRIDVQMGTLGKALGTAGAFVCGSRALVELLVNRARPFIYTTALPPPIACAAAVAVDIARGASELRERLSAAAARLRHELRCLGYDVPEGLTPIIPVHVGESRRALALSQRLLEHGVFVQAIRPPTVPAGTARLRVTVMATHTREDLDHAVAAFRAVQGK